MARVLVTGAGGFTGRHLLERLARDGHELHGVVHHANDEAPSLLHRAHVADLRDLSAVARMVEDVQPDKVVHLAAIAFVAHGDAAELYSSNILGTRNLLHALASASRQPQAVLVASSANVYGNRRDGVLDESLPPEPANDYGITKLTCEMLARLYADRLPIITVRPFNYTGLGQGEQFIIPKIIAHAKQRKAVIELGNIDVARDFSDVRAVVDSYARLLNAQGAIGGLFNVCSGQARSLAEVIEMVERLSGHHMEVQVNPAFVRADEVKSLCGSRARLESVIGALAMPTLEETIGWMLDA
ncbi:MAG: GDP-mannose 4,6-dehydratase [Alphaproteobacteria bacterium]|nr:GDP-mannose 4,6-dehydratase [Alphaproteobacteria bacterium]